MYVNNLELKLTSQPELHEHEGFSRIVFIGAAKVIDSEAFDMVNLIRCAYRATPESASAILATLAAGRRVTVAGTYEPQAFMNSCDHLHHLAVDNLALSRKKPVRQLESEASPGL
ncbi:hypothetical protein DV532_29240 (plasmid) [Pseudomonas sp. Leaf58]|uniref:hypothetical protein n=1 Tax=Pseudomonas sp. Leaf58 TaxID=1736226 RepID=UPI0006F67F2B|nr:hypothetical protein [Pseudomonas sp. Leaf58]AYG48332.1 hypothetical protein DV532_29240 [Pseudomonas sp. Leaf58]KQN62123.1 hypothetical protein ASF02_08050 [Pseudomonas sp. Leaf58]